MSEQFPQGMEPEKTPETTGQENSTPQAEPSGTEDAAGRKPKAAGPKKAPSDKPNEALVIAAAVLRSLGRFLKKLGANPYFKMVAILFVITAVVAGMLGLVNEMTYEQIAAFKQQAVQDAYQAVMPDSEFFEVEDQAYPDTVTNMLLARKDGELVGYVVLAAPQGFGGPVEICVGIDLQGRVTAVTIISQDETPGLGTKADDPDYLSQYAGTYDGVKRGTAGSENEIEAITGATVTSEAVLHGVQAALSAVVAFQTGGAVSE